jgi:tRNA dimethylallyltransferase
MKKIVCIVGPTAVGKTALAFELANLLNGTLVSADSVQVFKGLDIISGKDLPEGYTYNAGYYSHNGSPSICLLDVVESTSPFSVSDYLNVSSVFINQIFSEGKLPIVVGGTGLYVKALIDGLDTQVAPNLKLREELNALSISELQKKLPKEILQSLNESDKKNSRRLIRKIEILEYQPLATNHQPHTFYDSLVIGLKCTREILKERIDIRVDLRIKDGAVEEAADQEGTPYAEGQPIQTEGLYADVKKDEPAKKASEGRKTMRPRELAER